MSFAVGILPRVVFLHVFCRSSLAICSLSHAGGSQPVRPLQLHRRNPLETVRKENVMKHLQSSLPTRLIATLAIAAGIVTGALWHVGQIELAPAKRAMANEQIDPAIPALTITAKKLSAVEKTHLAHAEYLTRMLGMLTTTEADSRREKTGDAF
jgi:hypothetical protein